MKKYAIIVLALLISSGAHAQVVPTGVEGAVKKGDVVLFDNFDGTGAPDK